LIEQQKEYGSTFDKMDECKTFKRNEIAETEEKKKHLNEKYKENPSFKINAQNKYDGYLRFLNRLDENGCIQQDDPDSADGENDISSKCLHEYKDAFSNVSDFMKAVITINSFFLPNSTKSIDKPIFIKSGNIKKIAFALGEIWRGQAKNDVITFEYLQYCKASFTIFKKQKIEKSDVFGSNFYKYMISKT
jgi:hypothetical protein